jgi:cytochrome c
MEDLKQAPASRQIVPVAYCRGEYAVGLADGSVRKFGERDLRFATDSSALGPPPGRAVLVPTGRVGDRAIVVVVGPAEMAGAVRLGS